MTQIEDREKKKVCALLSPKFSRCDLRVLHKADEATMPQVTMQQQQTSAHHWNTKLRPNV